MFSQLTKAVNERNQLNEVINQLTLDLFQPAFAILDGLTPEERKLLNSTNTFEKVIKLRPYFDSVQEAQGFIFWYDLVGRYY